MKLEFSYEPKEFTKAMRKLQVLVILSKKKLQSLHTFYPGNGVAVLCIFHNQPYNKTMNKSQKYNNHQVLLYQRERLTT